MYTDVLHRNGHSKLIGEIINETNTASEHYCSYVLQLFSLKFVLVLIKFSSPSAPQIDVLQAEVQALKTLVLSSPTSPVGDLPSVGGGGVKTPFRKGHSRNKSTSSAILGTQPDPSATQPIVWECREVGCCVGRPEMFSWNCSDS